MKIMSSGGHLDREKKKKKRIAVVNSCKRAALSFNVDRRPRLVCCVLGKGWDTWTRDRYRTGKVCLHTGSHMHKRLTCASVALFAQEHSYIAVQRKKKACCFRIFILWGVRTQVIYVMFELMS